MLEGEEGRVVQRDAVVHHRSVGEPEMERETALLWEHNKICILAHQQLIIKPLNTLDTIYQDW